MAIQTNIFEMLKEDHQNVRKLFRQMKTHKSEHDGLFSQIGLELTIHMEGEEKLLYPMLRAAEPTREKTLEGWEEHNYAKVVLNDLKEMEEDDERWHAKLSVLQEMVEHHIQEEEGELFKGAKKVLGKEQAEKIGALYGQEKEKKSTSTR
jgi:hemerythrin superfamily protein